MFIRQNPRINQFENLLQVLVLSFFFLADNFKCRVDLIKSFAQGLQFKRGVLDIEISGKVPVMDRLNELLHFILCFAMKSVKINQLKNNNWNENSQINK